ncbi:MAG: hypothetical protein JXB29_04825 [Sedimentisphaerales bacterium]|nr:hypothetical protein [Sedimentisphaerales bacterium]
MKNKSEKIKVIDRKASENEYMHKDFHGTLCYVIKYLEDNYGLGSVEQYLQQVAKTYFLPLTQKLKSEGLKALENHWREVFTREDGKFNISYEDDKLVLVVKQCPAIAHLKTRDMFFTDKFCLTTKVVNKTICQPAGYDCSCEYKPGKGKCIQKFWKEQK